MLEPRKPRDYKDQFFTLCCRFAYSMIYFHLFSHQDNQYNRFAQACSLQYGHPSYCHCMGAIGYFVSVCLYIGTVWSL